MKKIFLAAFLSLFLAQLAPAQNKYIDSLKHLLLHAKEDTNKVDLLGTLGSCYVWSYPDTAIKYEENALLLAQKLNLKKPEFNILWELGEAQGMKGDYAQGLSTHLKLLRLSEHLGDKNWTYNSLFAIGTSYIWSGNDQKALDYFYIVKSHKNEFKDYTKTAEFIDGFMSMAYLDLNKLDSAKYYLHRGDSLDIKYKAHWYILYRTMANLFVKNGDYKRAINCLYPYSLKIGAGFDNIDSYPQIASIYEKMGMTDSAIYFAKKVLYVKQSTSLTRDVLPASALLTRVYASRHQTDSAFKYQGIMLAAKDSLFSREKINALQDVTNREAQRRQDVTTAREEIINRIRMYVLIGILAACLIVSIIVWRNYRQQKKANNKIQKTLAELKATQTQLIQSEKMASLGELTAGIAHEIQNPLNFVNNFSEVNKEMLEELKAESEKPKAERDEQLQIELINDLIGNEEKINHHGKRADFIVKGMLEHSRTNTGQKQLTDLNVLCDEFLKLSYHGLRAKDKSFNAEMVTHFDPKLPKVNVSQQDMGRVMLNLFNNAFYAVNQKLKTMGADYEPEVTVSTFAENGQVVIKVKDNGVGIPDAIKDKIMQPFFTTKPTGDGTGLGLSLTYDMVVKGHGGSIQVNSVDGEGSEFIIQLPAKENF